MSTNFFAFVGVGLGRAPNTQTNKKKQSSGSVPEARDATAVTKCSERKETVKNMHIRLAKIGIVDSLDTNDAAGARDL
jgi:hypothetical protein